MRINDKQDWERSSGFLQAHAHPDSRNQRRIFVPTRHTHHPSPPLHQRPNRKPPLNRGCREHRPHRQTARVRTIGPSIRGILENKKLCTRRYTKKGT
ncbi:hypothetical protein VTJ04DRAFT_3295 [Mycothermus thermophilus]|uniref:uncharacterized protein n=1 Tax=Humicola insolens TaxID=85995 RepID=UPI0037446FEE